MFQEIVEKTHDYKILAIGRGYDESKATAYRNYKVIHYWYKGKCYLVNMFGQYYYLERIEKNPDLKEFSHELYYEARAILARNDAPRRVKSLKEKGQTKTQIMNMLSWYGTIKLRAICDELEVTYNNKESNGKLKQKIVDALGLSTKSDKGKKIVVIVDTIVKDNTFNIRVEDDESKEVTEHTKLGLTSEELNKYTAKLLSKLKTTNLKINIIN